MLVVWILKEADETGTTKYYLLIWRWWIPAAATLHSNHTNTQVKWIVYAVSYNVIKTGRNFCRVIMWHYCGFRDGSLISPVEHLLSPKPAPVLRIVKTLYCH